MNVKNEIVECILAKANQDENIRAVYMNGSRTNPNAPKDIFQDYDIVYVVNETTPFLKTRTWMQEFGDLLIKQEPDQMDLNLLGKPHNFEVSYTFLMLFKSGLRIDLHIQQKEQMLKEYGTDSLTIPLLDKDQILPSIAPSNDTDYHVKKPSEVLFIDTCNEFWWGIQNVAKGIWRDELPFAKSSFEMITRPELDKVVSWWIGLSYDFKISTGKQGKYFKKFLPLATWQQYEQTYSDGKPIHFWKAVFITCNLFKELSEQIAATLGFKYDNQEATNMLAYLKHVANLPKDAKNLFDKE